MFYFFKNKSKRIWKVFKFLSKIYMIKSGYVYIYVNNKYIRTLSMNSPFGFKAILLGSKVRTAS